MSGVSYHFNWSAPAPRELAPSHLGGPRFIQQERGYTLRASFLLRIALARFSSTRYTTTASISGIRK